MKKIIAGIVTIAAVAVILNAQNSSSRPSSRPTTGQIKVPTCVPRATIKASSRPAGTATYKIETKYQPGLTYEIELQNKIELTDLASGKKRENVINLLYYIQTSPSDANGQLQLTIRLARMQNKSSSGQSYDSDNCTDPKAAMFMNILTKNNYQFTMSKDGVLGTIDGVDKAIDASGFDKTQTRSIEGEIAKCMSELILLPLEYANGYELAVGEEYESDSAQITDFGRPWKGRGSEKLVYKLTDVTTSQADKIATVDLQGTITFHQATFIRSGQMKFNLMKTFIENFRNESSGKFNDNENYIKKSEMTVKLVDKIPELKAASVPASQATSQASK